MKPRFIALLMFVSFLSSVDSYAQSRPQPGFQIESGDCHTDNELLGVTQILSVAEDQNKELKFLELTENLKIRIFPGKDVESEVEYIDLSWIPNEQNVYTAHIQVKRKSEDEPDQRHESVEINALMRLILGVIKKSGSNNHEALLLKKCTYGWCRKNQPFEALDPVIEEMPLKLDYKIEITNTDFPGNKYSFHLGEGVLGTRLQMKWTDPRGFQRHLSDTHVCISLSCSAESSPIDKSEIDLHNLEINFTKLVEHNHQLFLKTISKSDANSEDD